MDNTYIKTVAEFQLILFTRLNKQALGGTSSPASRAPEPSQRGSRTIGTKNSTDNKVGQRGNQQRRPYEMHKNKQQRQSDYRAK